VIITHTIYIVREGERHNQNIDIETNDKTCGRKRRREDRGGCSSFVRLNVSIIALRRAGHIIEILRGIRNLNFMKFLNDSRMP